MTEIQTPHILWVRGGRMIDPSQDYDMPGDILLEDGAVLASGNPADIAAQAQAKKSAGAQIEEIILSADLCVAPGLIDAHTHLREPGFEIKETIYSGAKAAARGGYTTVCSMPNTSPVTDSRSVVAQIIAAAHNAAIRVLPIGAITRGQEGLQLTEMYELAEAGVIAFSDDGKPVRSGAMMSMALNYALPLYLPIINHCEDPDIVGGGVMNSGPAAIRLGLKGWPSSGEVIMLQRDLELVRGIGARYHAAHLSAAGSVEAVRRAKDAGLRVTAEVTPHHLLLTDEWVEGHAGGILAEYAQHARMPQFNTNAKVNPPLRSAKDAEAVLQGLLDGVIDIVATDHAPHGVTDKYCSFDEAAFGISGIETSLSMLLTLARLRNIPLKTMIAAASTKPAEVFQLARHTRLPIGTLRAGAAADVVIFNPNERYTVRAEEFLSLGKNTPLDGAELAGKVKMTIYGGAIVWEDAHFNRRPQA